MSHNPQFTL